MTIRDLSTHPVPYVSVGELASYWHISRKQIHKHIDAGSLEAIRLGPRLFRIRTSVAREFEERARMRRPEDEAKPTSTAPLMNAQ